MYSNRLTGAKIMKIKLSKGVLAKDGTPYATKTIHAVLIDGWNCPYPYSIGCLCMLLIDKEVVSISVIDENNNQIDLTELR